MPNTGKNWRTTTCYMCACRCGIRVHLDDGKPVYIEGNPEHPVNRGVICAKGAAGLMHHFSPARLRAPLRRIGPRGSGKFVEIGWDEALTLATNWLSEIRCRDPKRLAFFTGRDQSQALTGYWASQFGTPNYAAHGGFCSVNMAAAGMYTIGGSFWEFTEPDWHRTRLLLLFGVAEDHGSNPIKIGLGEIRKRGGKIVSVNPVRTGYSAIADQWLAIRPGTDGLLIGALMHELLRMDRIDLDYLVRYTDAHWLVVDDPDGAQDGLIARDMAGQPLAWVSGEDNEITAIPAGEVGRPYRIVGRYPVEVAGPAQGKMARPVFALLAQRYLASDYAPESIAEQTGIAAETVRQLAWEMAETAFHHKDIVEQPWTDSSGRAHQCFAQRPVSIHAMRGISAHANGFDTARMLHILQMLLGAIDAPGGMLYKPPFPRPAPPGPKPAGKVDDVVPLQPLPGPPLGFVGGPEDLLVDEFGDAQRIDLAYSWQAPFAAHGLMHEVIGNAARGVPYPISVLFLYMANMGWNSAFDLSDTLAGLTAKDETGAYSIPHIIYSDAFWSETVPYADLVLPDTTYLERWDCVSLLDRPISTASHAADAIRQPVVAPNRNVRPFQDVLIELGARLGLPGFTSADGEPLYPDGYAGYLVRHQRKPGIGSLAGWRGDSGTEQGVGDPNPNQLAAYQESGCFWQGEIPASARYLRFANRDYLNWSRAMGFIDNESTMTLRLYSEPMQLMRLAGRGIGNVVAPEHLRGSIERDFDPLPLWRDTLARTSIDGEAFPFSAITQRPMAMYHSWGSHNAWLRQIHPSNMLHMHWRAARRLGMGAGDLVSVVTATGHRVRARLCLVDGVEENTVWTWNAIGKRRGAWGLDPRSPEIRSGFLLNSVISGRLPGANGEEVANRDPVTGQAAWYDLRVRVEPYRGDRDTVPPDTPPHSEMRTERLGWPKRLRFGAARALRMRAKAMRHWGVER